MEEKHRTILRHYWPNIGKDLEPNNILPDLGRVLTVKDDEEIKAKSTRQERCDKLLEILPRKGPNAFKVFVEALKDEAPHLASDLIEADKGTENELRHVREKSAKLQDDIHNLKTKLEAQKEDHIKKLAELETRHGTTKTVTREQIKKLHKIIQQLRDESTSCYEGLKDERDSARRENKTLEKEIQQLKKEKEDYEREKQTLQKNLESVKAEQGNQSSENLEAAKKEMRRLQGENRELKKQVKKQKSEFERRLKENLKSSQAEAKAKAVELQKIKLANKRLQEESNAERSKCDDLREEVRRLKEIMESYVL